MHSLDDGIYEEVDISEVGSATDINFTVKRRYLRDKFHLRARSAKSKKLSEEAFPRYGSDGFMKWFCEKATVAKLVEYTPM